MSRGSLRLRLFVAGAFSIALALALAGIGLGRLFERHAERRALEELSIFMDQVVAGIDRDASGAPVVADGPTDPRFTRPLSGLYWQVEEDGTVLRSRSLWDGALALPVDEVADGEVHRHRAVGPDGGDLLVLERVVTLPPRIGGRVRVAVALDRADIASATADFEADLVPYLLLLGLLLAAANFAQVTVGLLPLASVRDRVSAIRAGSLRRLGTDLPDEVRPLAVEVDSLLDALDERIKLARARAAELAHGLKTPLQVLSGDVDRLRKLGETALADDIDAVALVMRRHVDRELVRARVAAGAVHAEAAVRAVAERVVGVVRRTPAGSRLAWSVAAPQELSVHADPDDLTEALGNLVENAARHAVSRIEIGARREGDAVRIAVLDDGPGLTDERKRLLLDPDGRPDPAADGTGLGLSIVREIVAASGGRLELADGDPGLSAEIVLPASPGRAAPAQRR
ncbi:sensor histidine kinase [Propylenella binzhouense]|uniref:histidine kinase n=1 Tax=Propylenella binzhouense TaxID=2555902 RepID=A0A964T315_9HYPH|nr:HAMP domain-containing sensor histidine kinase [Propylenella binzhouense]MYZ47379.1 HAMP domain-containing histidine kinase [Propylenella binzhouense]